jgi:predicted transcriptional regulator
MSIGKTIRVGIMPLERVRDTPLPSLRVHTNASRPNPRFWFTSIKSFAAVLSDENRELLRIIHDNKPESIADLEQMTGRKASNLSRTLHTMANYGLVRLEGGSQGRGGRAVKPVALARSVNLTLDIGFGDKPAPRRVVRRQTEQITA